LPAKQALKKSMLVGETLLLPTSLILVSISARPVSQTDQLPGRAPTTLQAEQGIGQFVVRQTGRKANEP
jgi:hypothetical protein